MTPPALSKKSSNLSITSSQNQPKLMLAKPNLESTQEFGSLLRSEPSSNVVTLYVIRSVQNAMSGLLHARKREKRSKNLKKRAGRNTSMRPSQAGTTPKCGA